MVQHLGPQRGGAVFDKGLHRGEKIARLPADQPLDPRFDPAAGVGLDTADGFFQLVQHLGPQRGGAILNKGFHRGEKVAGLLADQPVDAGVDLCVDPADRRRPVDQPQPGQAVAAGATGKDVVVWHRAATAPDQVEFKGGLVGDALPGQPQCLAQDRGFHRRKGAQLAEVAGLALAQAQDAQAVGMADVERPPRMGGGDLVPQLPDAEIVGLHQGVVEQDHPITRHLRQPAHVIGAHRGIIMGAVDVQKVDRAIFKPRHRIGE